jgi:hypothetical protein
MSPVFTHTSVLLLACLSVVACERPPTQTQLGPSEQWPNEPAGLLRYNDQAWDRLTRPRAPVVERVAGVLDRIRAAVLRPPERDPWGHRRRASSKDDEIVTDATAPFSPPEELRIVFTPDMGNDHEPSVHWISLPAVREVYTGWWMKLSSNWTPSPAGGGKITFLWPPEGQGVVYSNLGGSSAPHRINIATTWDFYGYKFWEPNVTATPIYYDRWYRIEWYMKWTSSPGATDGIMRWWVNGLLNGDYRTVSYPSGAFVQFEFAPTLQNPPPAEQYMYIDHTYISIPRAP